ncbi:anillin-related medial ring protein Mid1 [Schizosaccharomyces pombe]|uniref:Anillin-related medial ring protein mid1 n=1 Tax=Schizosaccharomyces pombe (strain 972 / ATCC 24843) TaxID=284812 RepID=BUD4_SCHPO|nr:medial ring protein Mid1 [Schizosaccharomyces pombe]P78953.1 RecName: Full=Anillin-related medial ring protein mid1 [Schizosaccharomyces pombe 972h-]CAA68873.1 dmf1 [Schizosaccharomyces pombe]CAB60689.1 medial ring protein Mid1 [Schizosaccharomyces pombe]|eukprot:NP_588075.1 medial ring protein Mid1 [Schizosaccharomyces pombe]
MKEQEFSYREAKDVSLDSKGLENSFLSSPNREKTPLFFEGNSNETSGYDQTKNFTHGDGDMSLGNLSELNVATDLLESLDLRSMYMHGYGHLDSSFSSQHSPDNRKRMSSTSVFKRINSEEEGRIPSLTYSAGTMNSTSSSTASLKGADIVADYETFNPDQNLAELSFDRSKSSRKRAVEVAEFSRAKTMSPLEYTVQHPYQSHNELSTNPARARAGSVPNLARIPSDVKPVPPAHLSASSTVGPRILPSLPKDTTEDNPALERVETTASLDMDYKPLEPLAPIQEAPVEDTSEPFSSVPEATLDDSDISTESLRKKVLAKMEAKRISSGSSYASTLRKVYDFSELSLPTNGKDYDELYLQSSRNSEPEISTIINDSLQQENMDEDISATSIPKSQAAYGHGSVTYHEVPRYNLTSASVGYSISSQRGRIKSSSTIDNLSAILSSEDLRHPSMQPVPGTKRTYSNYCENEPNKSSQSLVSSESHNVEGWNYSETGTVGFYDPSAEISASIDELRQSTPVARDSELLSRAHSFDLNRLDLPSQDKSTSYEVPNGTENQSPRPVTSLGFVNETFFEEKPKAPLPLGRFYIHLNSILNISISEVHSPIKIIVNTPTQNMQLPWQAVNGNNRLDHDFAFHVDDNFKVSFMFLDIPIEDKSNGSKGVSATKDVSNGKPAETKSKARKFFDKLFNRRKKRKLNKAAAVENSKAKKSVVIKKVSGTATLNLGNVKDSCFGKAFNVEIPIISRGFLEAIPVKINSIGKRTLGNLTLTCLYIPELSVPEQELPFTLEQATMDLRHVRSNYLYNEGYLYRLEDSSIRRRFVVLRSKQLNFYAEKGGQYLDTFQLSKTVVSIPMVNFSEAVSNLGLVAGILATSVDRRHVQLFADSKKVCQKWLQVMNSRSFALDRGTEKLWLQEYVNFMA